MPQCSFSDEIRKWSWILRQVGSHAIVLVAVLWDWSTTRKAAWAETSRAYSRRNTALKKFYTSEENGPKPTKDLFLCLLVENAFLIEHYRVSSASDLFLRRNFFYWVKIKKNWLFWFVCLFVVQRDPLKNFRAFFIFFFFTVLQPRSPRCVNQQIYMIARASISSQQSAVSLSLIHIWRCRRDVLCRSRWSPYH